MKHSLKFFLTETLGARSIPEFVGVGFIDGVQFGNWNNRRGEEVKGNWTKLFEDYPHQLHQYTSECSASHDYFNATVETLKQRLNQTEGMDLFHLLLLKCLLSLLVLK